jgi:hypothetical protein
MRIEDLLEKNNLKSTNGLLSILKPMFSHTDITGKTFKVGDKVAFKYTGVYFGEVTLILVSSTSSHVVVDYNLKTLTDFFYVELDKSQTRDDKLNNLGITL